jgi:hypothetical protein
MEPKLVKVKPIGNKIRRKVKEHGDRWYLFGETTSEYHLATIKPVHCGMHPYEIWVSKKDCTLMPITGINDGQG